MSYNRSHGIARGFTLIELLVVIAIIATLAAVVAPAVFRNVGDAKVSAAKSQIDIFALALDSYRLDNDVFPTSAQGLDALRTAPTASDAAQLERPVSAQRIPRSMGAPVSLRLAGEGESDVVRRLLARPRRRDRRRRR